MMDQLDDIQKRNELFDGNIRQFVGKLTTISKEMTSFMKEYVKNKQDCHKQMQELDNKGFDERLPHEIFRFLLAEDRSIRFR